MPLDRHRGIEDFPRPVTRGVIPVTPDSTPVIRDFTPVIPDFFHLTPDSTSVMRDLLPVTPDLIRGPGGEEWGQMEQTCPNHAPGPRIKSGVTSGEFRGDGGRARNDTRMPGTAQGCPERHKGARNGTGVPGMTQGCLD